MINDHIYVLGWNTRAQGINATAPEHYTPEDREEWIRGYVECVAANLRAGGTAFDLDPRD